MVLGERPTTIRRNISTNISGSRSETDQIKENKSHRKGSEDQISKSIISCTQKGLSRRETNNKPLQAEQSHKIRNIQNVNNESSSAPTAQKLLDGCARHERRVLALTSHPKEKTIPGFPLQRSKLAIQSIAVRPQYRTTNIHKIDGTCCQSDGLKGDMVHAISRRPTNCKLVRRRMPTSFKNGHRNLTIFRMDPKRKEVAHKAATNLSVARRPLQPGNLHSSSSGGKDDRAKGSNKRHHIIKKMYKAENNESPRTSQLDRSIQPNYSSFEIQDKAVTKNTEAMAPRYTNKAHKRNETEPSKMADRENCPSATRQPYTFSSDTDRCVTKGFRFQDKSKHIPRNIRQNCRVLHQHARATNNLVCTSKGRRKKFNNSSPMRQFHSNFSRKTGHIKQFSNRNDCRDDLEKSGCSQLDPISFTYPRQVQRNCRPTFKRYHHIHRMGTTSEGFQTDNPQTEPKNTGRLVRYQSKSPIGNIYFPLSRRESSSSGCNDGGLEQMESPISVSTNEFNFEGFSEAERDSLQVSSPDNTEQDNGTMAHGTTTQESSFDNNHCASTTDSEGQIDKSPQTHKATRVELITAALNKQYPDAPRAVELMATPLRKSSLGDYQQKWKCFISFLVMRDISLDCLKITHVLQFFTYLFYEKHLKPGTIAHYRSALTVPLKVYFHIDLKTQAVSDLIKSMFIQRPNKPVTAPTWSLNKVLEFLDNLDVSHNKTMLLKKSAFLLLLATGWRISELHACVRDTDFCRFTGESLFLRPHPSFLAKNESTQDRWGHKEIKVLKLSNNIISNLCPVTTLKEYLEGTHSIKTGDLFLTPDNKKMSIHKLSSHLCSLILQADPNTKVKIHDVRRYASSCALAETMLMGDLVSSMNWSNQATFVKFYLTQTDPLDRPAAFPLQKVSRLCNEFTGMNISSHT